MTQKEINDYNEMCASFLGWEKLDTDSEMQTWKVLYKNNEGEYKYTLNMQFHSDWNFIIEVIEKIELLSDKFHGCFRVIIDSNTCTIKSSNLKIDNHRFSYTYHSECISETKKEAVVDAINEFLTFYNHDNYDTIRRS